MEKEKELCMTPVDLAAGGEELQLLKAMVPYLALGLQKPFVLLIKCMEIRNLTAFFSRPVILDVVVSLDTGSRQVSHHGDESSHCTDQGVNRRAVIKLREKFSGCQGVDKTQKRSSHNAPHSALDGFLRA